MGFLFLIVMGILGIILIARLASRSGRKEEVSERPAPRQNGRERHQVGSIQMDDLENALVSLLIKKKVITEKEFLAEIERLKKDK